MTLADVASAAQVTVQTLLNHFGSKEGLLAAALEVFAAEVEDLRGHVDPGDVEGAIDALMRHYEALGDANWRAVADSDSQPILREMLEIGRAEHRAWLVDLFGPHLPGAAAAREVALTALFAATDVGTWKLLRRDLWCEPEATRATLLALVSGLLRKE